MQECMFNSYSNNCCAYCRHHHCSMTVKQMKAKGCLQKQCWHLVKNEQHAYWRQREVIKEKRKQRKQFINDYVNAHTNIVTC